MENLYGKTGSLGANIRTYQPGDATGESGCSAAMAANRPIARHDCGGPLPTVVEEPCGSLTTARESQDPLAGEILR